jgi:hypothetical protein
MRFKKTVFVLLTLILTIGLVSATPTLEIRKISIWEKFFYDLQMLSVSPSPTNLGGEVTWSGTLNINCPSCASGLSDGDADLYCVWINPSGTPVDQVKLSYSGVSCGDNYYFACVWGIPSSGSYAQAGTWKVEVKATDYNNENCVLASKSETFTVVSACSDECSSEGKKTCDTTWGYKICGNYDGDSCLEWSDTIFCANNEKCENGICETVPGGCLHDSDCCSDYPGERVICTHGDCNVVSLGGYLCEEITTTTTQPSVCAKEEEKCLPDPHEFDYILYPNMICCSGLVCYRTPHSPTGGICTGGEPPEFPWEDGNQSTEGSGIPGLPFPNIPGTTPIGSIILWSIVIGFTATLILVIFIPPFQNPYFFLIIVIILSIVSYVSLSSLYYMVV